MRTNQVNTRTRDTVLLDDVRVSPVDEQLLRNHRKVFWILLLIVLLIFAIELV